jgi:hypothetical protein
MTHVLDRFRSRLDDYVEKLNRFATDEACSVASDTIRHLKALLQDDTAEEDQLNGAFYLAVLFRGLYDFAKLRDLTAGNWLSEKDRIQAVWNRLCDCQDRLQFAGQFVGGRTLDRIRDSIREIDQQFLTRFGQGWYMSPTFSFLREICSICGKDMRICTHVSGHIYRGRLCSIKVDGIGAQLCSASLVRVPRDHRCRVWPWQVQDKAESDVLIMSLFQLDDFMEKAEWN